MNVSNYNIKVKLRTNRYKAGPSNPVVGTEYECAGLMIEATIDGCCYNKNNIEDILKRKIDARLDDIEVRWDNGISNFYSYLDLVLDDDVVSYRSIW